MNPKKFLKRLVPTVLAGAAVLVLAMPMTAMAHEWHHDNGRHFGWFHRDRDDHCDFRGGRNFYPRNYYQGPPAYSYGQQPYAFGGYGNNPRMNFLQQKWDRAEAAHQNALANGNRRAAKITSNRLYQLDRQMGVNGNRYYRNDGYNSYPYASPYTQNGPVFGQLGNMFGLW